VSRWSCHKARPPLECARTPRCWRGSSRRNNRWKLGGQKVWQADAAERRPRSSIQPPGKDVHGRCSLGQLRLTTSPMRVPCGASVPANSHTVPRSTPDSRCASICSVVVADEHLELPDTARSPLLVCCCFLATSTGFLSMLPQPLATQSYRPLHRAQTASY
jgi:hypothetical protein